MAHPFSTAALATATLLTVTLFTFEASASSAFAMSVPELQRSAHRVVRGKVRATHSEWTADHRRIVTRVELVVQEALKGSAQNVTLVQRGGVVGDIAQVAQGLTAFERGEDVVVFLEPGPGGWRTVGMSQGVFRVHKDVSTGQEQAIPAVEASLQLLNPQTRAPVKADRRPIPLETLRQQVRQAAALHGRTR